MITNLAIETKPAGPGSYEHRLVLELPGRLGEPVVITRVRSPRIAPDAGVARALLLRAAEAEA